MWPTDSVLSLQQDSIETQKERSVARHLQVWISLQSRTEMGQVEGEGGVGGARREGGGGGLGNFWGTPLLASQT